MLPFSALVVSLSTAASSRHGRVPLSLDGGCCSISGTAQCGPRGYKWGYQDLFECPRLGYHGLRSLLGRVLRQAGRVDLPNGALPVGMHQRCGSPHQPEVFVGLVIV